MRTSIAILLVLLVPQLLQAAPRVTTLTKNPNFFGKQILRLNPSRTIIYKQSEQQDLSLEIFEPAASSKKPRVCFIAIHGGGWIGGDPSDVYPYLNWANKHGMLGVSVQYRLLNPNKGTSVFDCVRDVRSAVRYVREHAKELNIDPNKIIVFGVSAGGHLALSTNLLNRINDPKDNLSIAAKPNAMILLSPVIDTSERGYGQSRIGKRWKELSPLHNMQTEIPPTLVLHSDTDKRVPIMGALEFQQIMRQKGYDGVLFIEKNQPHVYMQKREDLYQKTLDQMKAFLIPRGFISK